jgi:predicted ester cyclase
MSAASNTTPATYEKTGERQRNIELLRRIIDEGFNKGNLAVVDELVDPGFEEHQFFGPHHPSGPAGLKAVILDCRRMFPDFHMTFEDISTNEDTVWARLHATGTHGGEILGRPPTGRKIAIDVMELARFRDGKMVEHWGIPDRFHMLFQIGVLGGTPARP